MRNKVQKTRCEKQMLPKFEGICKTYDKVQGAAALVLSQDDEIVSIRCNVESVTLDGVTYTSDFVCTLTNGDIAVRECVFRKFLMKPLTVKLLDASRQYWLNRGISDWGIVIEKLSEGDSAE